MRELDFCLAGGSSRVGGVQFRSGLPRFSPSPFRRLSADRWQLPPIRRKSIDVKAKSSRRTAPPTCRRPVGFDLEPAVDRSQPGTQGPPAADAVEICQAAARARQRHPDSAWTSAIFRLHHSVDFLRIGGNCHAKSAGEDAALTRHLAESRRRIAAGQHQPEPAGVISFPSPSFTVSACNAIF